MPALLKFLLLLASFHSGSYAHAFTSLSPVVGNQVRVNHLIRFQQSRTNQRSKEEWANRILLSDQKRQVYSNILPRWRVTICKTFIFSQASANDKILRHEGVWQYPLMDILSGDLAFSHQHGIYGFKFPKRFLEISSRDLTLLSILII